MEAERDAMMVIAYDELVNFIAAGTTSESVANFQLSEQTKDRVADLIHRQKTTGLSAEETSELDHYLEIEHIMRLAKARAHKLLAQEHRACP